jgi:hypothetical protein
MMLPQLEQVNLHKSYDFDVRFDHANNQDSGESDSTGIPVSLLSRMIEFSTTPSATAITQATREQNPAPKTEFDFEISLTEPRIQ